MHARLVDRIGGPVLCSSGKLTWPSKVTYIRGVIFTDRADIFKLVVLYFSIPLLSQLKWRSIFVWGVEVKRCVGDRMNGSHGENANPSLSMTACACLSSRMLSYLSGEQSTGPPELHAAPLKRRMKHTSVFAFQKQLQQIFNPDDGWSLRR